MYYLLLHVEIQLSYLCDIYNNRSTYMEKYSYGEIQVCIGPVSHMYAMSSVYMYKNCF